MATSLRDAPICHKPRQVEARLHTIHLQWEAGQQVLKQEEQTLRSLHQHEMQLRLLVRETFCGKAPALMKKLAWIEAQVALTQGRIAQEKQRCQELAAQFDAVQVALAVARRQARQKRLAWSFSHLRKRLLQRMTHLARQVIKWIALADQEWWKHGL